MTQGTAHPNKRDYRYEIHLQYQNAEPPPTPAQIIAVLNTLPNVPSAVKQVQLTLSMNSADTV